VYHRPMLDAKHSDRAADFALQEHSELRAEIRDLIKDSRTLERNVIVGIGVVWGFLALHIPSGWDRWAWWVPVLFAVLGSLRTFGMTRAFRQYGAYLKHVETAFFGADDIEGWENFLLKDGRRALGPTTLLFWILLLLMTAAVAIYKVCSTPVFSPTL
jgi:hypothetical protein